MKKKRLLGILLSITLILGLTPGICMTARATATEYDIWIAGVRVTSENMNNVLPGTVNDGKVSFTPSSGSDPAILKLNGVDISYNNSNENEDGVIKYIPNGQEPLIIDLSGTNILSSATVHGLYCMLGSVTITGSGSLKITSEGNDSNGINTFSCDLTIDGDSTVTTESKQGIGINANKNVTIKGKAVTAIGRYGISASNHDITINKGVVHATGTDTDPEAAGIHCYHSVLSINGGEVYSEGKNGIYCGESAYVSITNGELHATGTGSDSQNAGIRSNKNVEIKGGRVISKGNTKAINGPVNNLIEGTGWINTEGTLGEGHINKANQSLPYPVQYFDDYKKVVFPVYAEVTTLPTPKSSTYDGQEHELLATTGAAIYGTMQYVASDSNITAPTDGWGTDIPTKTDAGTYFVWYYAEGKDGFKSTTPAYVTATISNPAPPTPTPIPIIITKAIVSKAPVANALTYDGQPQELVTAGEATGGTMQYALGKSASSVPTSGWSTSIPTGTDVGTYYVWYKAKGDIIHTDSDPKCVIVTIKEKHSDNVISIDEEKGIATVKDDVSGGTAEVPIEVITEGPIYRMYDPNRGEHLYTKKWADVEVLLEWGWIHESDSDFTVVDATDEDAMPVYRLYNPNFGGMHYYTDNAEDAKYLASVGWNYEGISHYVYKASSTKGTPQHKLYNPNSPSGEHIWLSDEAGIDMLIEAGWIYEGICWRIAFDQEMSERG